MDIVGFIESIVAKDEQAMRGYFLPDAHINWPCTNEHFSLDEFIKVNCGYPSEWGCLVERIEMLPELYITVTHVFKVGDGASYHATAFVRIKDDKVICMDEYWAEDSALPEWRK